MSSLDLIPIMSFALVLKALIISQLVDLTFFISVVPLLALDKKDAFREFIRSKPYLVTKVKNKETSWQELYEIYDLYGEDENAWNKFKDEDRAAPLSELASLVKNINMDNVQKYINNAQKAINVIQELTNKPTTNTNIVTPKTPRAMDKFFGD